MFQNKNFLVFFLNFRISIFNSPVKYFTVKDFFFEKIFCRFPIATISPPFNVYQDQYQLYNQNFYWFIHHVQQQL